MIRDIILKLNTRNSESRETYSGWISKRSIREQEEEESGEADVAP